MDSGNPLVPGFSLLTKLASGHAGSVFLAVDSSAEDGADQKSHVAIKVFQGKNALRDFETELRVLKAVQGHPNVVTVISDMKLNSHEASGAIVLEYHARGNLLHRLREQGPVTELEAKATIADTLRALAHIHALEIIHRDVKPENIVLNTEGRCVLIDFDIACYESDHAAKMRRAGTVGFMAPEVIKCRPYGRSVDVFGAGALLFFLFHLNHPFATKVMTEDSVLLKTQKCEYQFGAHFDHVGAPCKAFISSLLQRKSKDRPSAALALRDAWFTTTSSATSSVTAFEDVREHLEHPAQLLTTPDHSKKELTAFQRSQSLESPTDATEVISPFGPQPPETQRAFRWFVVPSFLSRTRKLSRLQPNRRTVDSTSTSGDGQADEKCTFSSLLTCNVERHSLAAPASPKRSGLLATFVQKTVRRRPMQQGAYRDGAIR